ncbi:hydrolase, alpha/beta superfamily [Fulvivirga imtechensis AK7]|uniref:Hydrolase, alpha/beta superfamily n=2 Tax=Fulvivirga TaxID=396811 RepID=L8JUA8_9BACT|nr:hydrolase, alpha/beta superfamily [Fulvivirga imtechensis AK7]
MLAFHGFGQKGSDFRPLTDVLANEYTVYCFDLFYHGRSYWNNKDEAMTKNFWADFINYFIEQHNISTFSLCGFSLGGKFALSTLESFPEKTEKLILLAPDGIKTSMWYSLATYPVAFKGYFKSMIVKPHRFFNLLNTINKTGWLEKGISKFAATQMNTTKKRRRVYFAWVVFKELKFKLHKLGKLINDHGIEVTMYLGTYDKIITEKGMQKLLKHLNDYKLHVIKSGHNQLIENTARHITRNKA